MSVKADGKLSSPRTSVQFNDAGAFGGAAALRYDTATDATLFQGQANHEASLGAELLENPTLEIDATGWTGVGWTWGPSPFMDEFPILTHDPLETDLLIVDTPVANTDDVILVTFSIGGYVAGALDVGLGVGPGYISGSDGHAIIAGDGQHVVAFFADTEDVQLFFNPQPSGYADVFDGYLAAPFSVKKFSFSDPLLISKLTDDSDASIRVHVSNVSNALYGFLAGRGMSPNEAVSADNFGFGSGAMEAAWSARHCVGLGSDTLRFAPKAENTVAIGAESLRRGQEAHGTVAIGGHTCENTYQALDIVAIGDRALANLVRGEGLTVIGAQAGGGLTSSIGSVLIGDGAGGDLVDEDYQLRISHWISDPVPLIAGDFQAQTLTIGGDLDFSDDSQGPILIDRTTATRYRLYVDSGVLSIEAV
jgi:hypothetical protein